MAPYKVGFIGCGRPLRSEGATGFGMSHAHAIGYKTSPDCVITALADINLDIEDSSATDQKEELNPQDKSEQWQEIETKLDLAKAYQEMDDKEGAKEMLEEVIRDGDAKQKKTARKLMKSLS